VSWSNDQAASAKKSTFKPAGIFGETLVAESPQQAVTVVGNHETQPLQILEAPVE
jgi:alpha-amylase